MVQTRNKIDVSCIGTKLKSWTLSRSQAERTCKITPKLSPLANIRSHLSLIPTPFPGMTVAQHSRVRDEVGDNFRCYFRHYLSSLTLQRPVRYLRDVHSQGSKDVFTCCHYTRSTVQTVYVLKVKWKQSAHTFQLHSLSPSPDIEARSGIIFVTLVFTAVPFKRGRSLRCICRGLSNQFPQVILPK